VPDEVTIAGRLARDVVAPGSKSERGALVLETDEGDVYLVRRRGAPSWGDDDPELATLEGRAVALTGSLVAGTILVDSSEVVEEG